MANTSTLDIKIFENVHGVLSNFTGTLTKANTAVVGLTSSVNTLATSFSQITNAVQNVDSSAETAVDKLLKLRSSVADGLKNFADGIIYVHGLGDAIKGLNETSTITGKVFQPVMDGVKKGLQIGMGAFNSYRTQVIAARSAIASTTGAARVLNMVIASSGWGLAIAGVTALCVGIYKLIDGTSNASKHYKKLNESLVEMDSNIMAEELALDRLFRRLNNAKEGTEEWNKIRNQINDRYGDYLKNMGIEIENAESAKKAYDALKKSILEVTRARFITKEIEDSEIKFSEKKSKNIGNIRKTIIDLVGNEEEGSELFNLFIEKLHSDNTYDIEKLLENPEFEKTKSGKKVKSLIGSKYSFEHAIINEALNNIKKDEKDFKSDIIRIRDIYQLDTDEWGLPIESKPKKPARNPIVPSFHLPQRGSTSFMRDPFNFIDFNISEEHEVWGLPKYKTLPFTPVLDSTTNKENNIYNNLNVYVSNTGDQNGTTWGTQLGQAFIKEVSESLTSLA